MISSIFLAQACPHFLASHQHLIRKTSTHCQQLRQHSPPPSLFSAAQLCEVTPWQEMCQVVMEVWGCGHTKVHLIRACPRAGNFFTRIARKAPTTPCELGEVTKRVFKPEDEECFKFPPCPVPDWPCCACFAAQKYSNNTSTTCTSCGHGRCGRCFELRMLHGDDTSFLLPSDIL